MMPGLGMKVAKKMSIAVINTMGSIIQLLLCGKEKFKFK
jgi:hypothetical protein